MRTGIWISTKPKKKWCQLSSLGQRWNRNAFLSKSNLKRGTKNSMPFLVWTVFFSFFFRSSFFMLPPPMLMVQIIVYFINPLLFNMVSLPQTNDFFLSRYYAKPEMVWKTKNRKTTTMMTTTNWDMRSVCNITVSQHGYEIIDLSFGSQMLLKDLMYFPTRHTKVPYI